MVRTAALVLAGFAAAAAAATPADSVYRNGKVYTVDTHESVQQALAIRSGTLVYVGTNTGVEAYIGPHTAVHDLQGRMLMPGLVDGHLHPLAGGRALLQCNLNYERLTVTTLQGRIQACLDATRDREPDGWLEVSNWFQEAMLGDTATSHATLDSLQTKRPILVLSSFGHTALVNTRALELAHITSATPDPAGGRIERDAEGRPTGILQDAAFEQVRALIPKPTPSEDIRAAEAALTALNRQGVTTFLDAAADTETLAAFAGAHQNGKLTARAHFAIWIKPAEGQDPRKAIERAHNLAQQYATPETSSAPGLTVRNIKLFLDGVITAPACTGALLAPYFVNRGTAEHPDWAPGQNRGPDVYFPAPLLGTLLLEAAVAGFEPHMHADGDRAVRSALDAVQSLRKRFPERTLRAAIAHDEIVDPADFERFRRVGALPVLSFQWEKPAPDTLQGERDYLGPARYKYIEPAGFLQAAGARIAFGSDWPVDPLDEWFALKVGITRTNSADVEPAYRGRLSDDPGLPRAAVLRAITLNAAYELHEEAHTGSLEPGKFADFIVLDRDFFTLPAEDIANIQVVETVVGGQTVYEAAKPAARASGSPRLQP